MVLDTLPEALAAAVIGLLLCLVTAWATRGMAVAHAAIAQGLLGPSPAQLRARVAALQASRDRAVDSAEDERRRIERDLHDGAQQRLVALAMDLGMAREKLRTDPQAATELVGEAHEEAKRALADLRDLARGAPVVRALDDLLRLAVEQRATDLHIEPLGNVLQVTGAKGASEQVAGIAHAQDRERPGGD